MKCPGCPGCPGKPLTCGFTETEAGHHPRQPVPAVPAARETTALTEGDPAPMGTDQTTGIDVTPLLLTVEEAAKRLGVGRTTFYSLVMSGEVESVPLGRLRRIPAECLTEYVERLRANARRDAA